MSTPVNALQQLMAPWMTGANPSALDSTFAGYGGTQGLLAALMQGAGPQTSQARQGAALADAQHNALANAQARQQLATGAFGLSRMQQSWPLIMAAMQGLSGNGAGSQGSEPANSDDASPGTSAGNTTDAGTAGSAGSSNATWMPNNATTATPTGAPFGAPAAATSPTASAPQRPMASADPTAQALRYGRLGAMMSLAGMPGSSLTDYSKLLLANDPSAITQRAVAGNPLTQDLALYRQAAQSGNPRQAQAAYFKYLKDAGQVTVDRYGNVVTLGGMKPTDLGVSTFLPQQGVQTQSGVMSAIPGATGTREALAGAQALGAAQGDVEEATDTTGAVTGQVGGKYYIPRSQLLGGRTPASRAPGIGTASEPIAPAGAATPVAALGPQQEKYLTGQGEEAAKYIAGLQSSADAARTANYNFDQMLADAKTAQLGAGAPTREFFMKITSGIGQQFGVAPPKELSSYQELDKYANQVAFAATKQMGSREAAQIVHLQMQSNPNKTLTPDAFVDLTHSMQAMNNYIIAKNEAIQQSAKANGGDAQAAAAAWDRTVDPRAWDVTLSGAMGAKWAPTIGAKKLSSAMQYMEPREQLETFANSPQPIQMQLLKLLPPQMREAMINAS